MTQSHCVVQDCYRVVLNVAHHFWATHHFWVHYPVSTLPEPCPSQCDLHTCGPQTILHCCCNPHTLTVGLRLISLFCLRLTQAAHACITAAIGSRLGLSPPFQQAGDPQTRPLTALHQHQPSHPDNCTKHPGWRCRLDDPNNNAQTHKRRKAVQTTGRDRGTGMQTVAAATCKRNLHRQRHGHL
jgi:hypothetical protein